MSSNSCNSRNLLRYACGGWNNPCSPYYNGPCPDADGGFAGTSCGCRPRPGNGGAERSAQGRFMSPMPLNTIAGACVPLMPCGDPCGLETAGGAVEIKDAGVYYAAYTLSLPAGTALTTTLTPTLNGAALPAGAVEVETTGEAAQTVSGQVIFRGSEDDRFAVASSEALSLPAAVVPALMVETMRIGD